MTGLNRRRKAGQLRHRIIHHLERALARIYVTRGIETDDLWRMRSTASHLGYAAQSLDRLLQVLTVRNDGEQSGTEYTFTIRLCGDGSYMAICDLLGITVVAKSRHDLFAAIEESLHLPDEDQLDDGPLDP